MPLSIKEFYNYGAKEPHLLTKKRVLDSLIKFVHHGYLIEEAEEAARTEFKEFLGYTEAQSLFAKVVADYRTSQHYKDREELLISDIVKVKSRKDEYYLNHKLKKYKYKYDVTGNGKTLFGSEAFRDIIRPKIIVCETKYAPTKNSDFFEDKKHTYLNLYCPPFWRFKNFYYGEPVPVVTEMPLEIQRFITHLLPDEVNRNFVLDWAANSLRNKNQLFLVLIGKTGIGKGILAGLLGAVHGSEELNDTQNFFETSFKRFMETKFNAFMETITLFFLDEIKIQTELEENALKTLVNKNLSVEGKGKDQVNKEFHASVIMASNFQSAAKLDSDDRRYAFPDLGETKIVELLNREYNGMDPDTYCNTVLYTKENIEGFAQYLWHRKISSNLYVPPKTKQAKKVKIAATRDEVRFLIEEFCVEHAGQTILETDVKTAVYEYNRKRISIEQLRQIQAEFPGVFKIGQAKPTKAIYNSTEMLQSKKRPVTLSILPESEQTKHPFGVLDEKE